MSVHRISTMLHCKISECNVYFLKTGFFNVTHSLSFFLSFLVQPPHQIPLSQKTKTTLYISFYVFNCFGSLIFYLINFDFFFFTFFMKFGRWGGCWITLPYKVVNHICSLTLTGTWTLRRMTPIPLFSNIGIWLGVFNIFV